MPATLKEMQEKREPIGKRINELRIAADGRDWEGDEEANWEAANKDYDEITRDIQRQERCDEIEADMGASDLGEQLLREANPDHEGERQESRDQPDRRADQAVVFDAWLRSGRAQLSDEHREACRRVGFNPGAKELEISLAPDEIRNPMANIYRVWGTGEIENRVAQFAEQRNLSAILGTTGAMTISPTFIVNLEQNMLAFGGMLQVAQVIRTARGEPLTWPTVDDTSNTGEQLGESTSEGSSVDPTFGQKLWHAFKYHSKVVKVPTELFEDSSFNIAGIISAMLGERLGRITNTRMTTGTGAGQPTGITVATTAGVTSAASTIITLDEVLDLVHSIDPAYRIASGRFMFHDNILLHLRKKKDGEGRYQWQQGIGGAPDTLWTYPYTINQDMSSTITSGDITMEFGQLTAYKIRQVRGVRLRRLDERYADTDEVGFNAFLRQDGNLLTAGTAPVKHMVQV